MMQLYMVSTWDFIHLNHNNGTKPKIIIALCGARGNKIPYVLASKVGEYPWTSTDKHSILLKLWHVLQL